jgi:DNA-binding Xre family transcriptional regulator
VMLRYWTGAVLPAFCLRQRMSALVYACGRIFAYNPLTMEIDVDKLVKLRIDEGLSQRQLAAKAGVTNTSVWKLEHGGNVRPATLKKIADVFGVKPTDLLKEWRA